MSLSLSQAQLDASLQTIGLAPDKMLFTDLQAVYAEPQRHYHTAAHIESCLNLLRSVKQYARHAGEIEMAIWFHDAVYDTHRDDNESASADWARRYLQHHGVPTTTVERVARMIEATRTHDADDPDTALMLDIDLAILGADESSFEIYDTQIRAEFSWVPESGYREGRARILRSFLDRPSIFKTDYFKQNFEAQARRNLAGKLAQLAGAQ